MRLPHALFAAAACLASLCRAEPTVATLKRVADWQLAHPSTHEITDWTQAAFYNGVMALADVSQDARYSQAMDKVGDATGWRLGPRTHHADDHAVGQMYLERYLKDGGEKRFIHVRDSLDFILAHPRDNNLVFDSAKNPNAGDRWSWCDSLFMAPPTWIRLYSVTHDKRYLDFAVEKWWVTSDYLFDKAEHLYFRDDTYFTKRETNGKKIFWSRGNGWVMGGLVRMLQHLPVNHPSRARFVAQFQEMAEALLKCQQADGLWRSSLLDPENYPLREASGTGFYVYAFAWGVNHRLLDAERFKPAALKGWAGLLECVEPDGKLTHVQPIGADPKHFPADATEVYGVGAFLLAGSEIVALKGE